MTTVSVPDVRNTVSKVDGLRPVNLRSDLAPLADLLELVFNDNMDSNGRAALRDMRTMSKIGVGLTLRANLNEMAFGISLGYVWIADGKLVGNASIYPARWPQELGSAWIIANVGVHPAYQRRGIATQLIEACQQMIRKRGGTAAILQVDADNDGARRIYERAGFRVERTWHQWRRTASNRAPEMSDHQVMITSRRVSEWQAEYALAQRVRPAELGGVGWQQPLHPSLFRRSLRQWLGDWLNMRHFERLVIRTENDEIGASLWVSNLLGYSTLDLTLMVAPEYEGLYDDALLQYAVRRYGRSTLRLDYPTDADITNALIEQHGFRLQRTLNHMRWDVA